jgi:hypothetical protein
MGRGPEQTLLQRWHTNGQKSHRMFDILCLTIRETQLETTPKCHLTPIRTDGYQKKKKERKKEKPDSVAHTCNPNYLEG